MTIDESTLSKTDLATLKAMRRSAGEKLADKTFERMLKERPDGVDLNDPTVKALSDLLEPIAGDKKLNLGLHGYSVKRARGKGAKGLIITKLDKSG
jgi:hypothetical protein